MKILFGREAADTKSKGKNYTLFRSVGYYGKAIRIALLVVFLLFTYLGPYQIWRIQNYEESTGVFQTHGRILTKARHRPRTETRFEIVVDGQRYDLLYKYLDVSPDDVELKLWDNWGKEVSIKYIPNRTTHHEIDLLIELSSDGEQLFNAEYLWDLWMKEALQATGIGLLTLMVGCVFYLKEIGWIRIVWEKNRN